MSAERLGTICDDAARYDIDYAELKPGEFRIMLERNSPFGSVVLWMSAPAAAAIAESMLRLIAAQSSGSVQTRAKLAPAYTLAKLREKNPSAYAKWTRDEDDRLRAGFVDGKTVDELSSAHGRGRGAIQSRLQKLGLVAPEYVTERLD